ncbi:MAG: hypothetical protein QM477_06090, partial [Planctomycetota bacterium]
MTGLSFHHLLIFCLTVCFAAPLSGQVIRYDREGIPLPLAQLSDIDGDGVAEYFSGQNNLAGEEFIQIYSLALNQPLVEWSLGPTIHGFVGEDAPMPFDLNQDGFLDFVFRKWGAGIPGTLVAHSGLDGSILWERSDFALPNNLTGKPAALGDRNGDGIVDFAHSLAGGEIVHLSGLDGSTLQRNPNSYVGWKDFILPAGDLDRDGIPDYFMEKSFQTSAFSGASDTILFTLPNGVTQEENSLSYVGDVNGDGFDDFAYFSGISPGGRVPMLVWTGSPPVQIGFIPGHHHSERSSRYPILHYDWDGDGVEDLSFWGESGASGAFLPNPSYFRIYSLVRSENLLLQITGHLPFGRTRTLGRSNKWVYWQNDYDGDSKPDPLYITNSNGRENVEVLSLKPHLQISTQAISQSTGGLLTLDVDATARFANQEVFLLAGAPGAYNDQAMFSSDEWFLKFGIHEILMLPFGRIELTNQLWRLRKSSRPVRSKFMVALDTQGKGTLVLNILPNAIDPGRVGRGLSFAFMLPDP